MQAYIVSRLITAVWVIAGLTSLVFFLIHWVPGDPVEVMLGESAAAADRAAFLMALSEGVCAAEVSPAGSASS